MKIHVISISNPQWANPEKTTINCEITTIEYGNEILPFTACASDVEEHGRLVFDRIISGQCGQIAEYIPPEEPDIN